MNTQASQNSKMEKHNAAIRTTAAFSGLELEGVMIEFEKRFQFHSIIQTL
ncbi:hypothetical protein [Kaarinaea lacus]